MQARTEQSRKRHHAVGFDLPAVGEESARLDPFGDDPGVQLDPGVAEQLCHRVARAPSEDPERVCLRGHDGELNPADPAGDKVGVHHQGEP